MKDLLLRLTDKPAQKEIKDKLSNVYLDFNIFNISYECLLCTFNTFEELISKHGYQALDEMYESFFLKIIDIMISQKELPTLESKEALKVLELSETIARNIVQYNDDADLIEDRSENDAFVFARLAKAFIGYDCKKVIDYSKKALSLHENDKDAILNLLNTSIMEHALSNQEVEPKTLANYADAIIKKDLPATESHKIALIGQIYIWQYMSCHSEINKFANIYIELGLHQEILLKYFQKDQSSQEDLSTGSNSTNNTRKGSESTFAEIVNKMKVITEGPEINGNSDEFNHFILGDCSI